MLRQLTDDALMLDMQHDLERANALWDELARRNCEFVSHCVDLAEAGELGRLSVPEARAEIEDLSREAMRQLRSVQMGTSMKAHRAGHDVAELVGVRRLTGGRPPRRWPSCSRWWLAGCSRPPGTATLDAGATIPDAASAPPRQRPCG